MNELIRNTLKKILEMQIDCTQILTTILFKNNETNQDEHLYTNKQNIEEQKNQIELSDKKYKKKLLNNEKSIEITKQKHSDQQLIQDTITQMNLSPEKCYSKLNNIIQEFRQRNSLEIQNNNFDFEYVKDYHNKIKFKELRNKIKFMINSIENQKILTTNFNGKRLFQCSSCNFQGFSSLYYPHILKKHCQNYYIFSCFLCQRDFQSFTLLRKHLKRYHSQILNTSSDIEIIKIQQDDNENDLSISI